MRLHITASLLTMLCSWIMWERLSLLSDGTPAQLIKAVYETHSLSDCNRTIPDEGKATERALKESYKEPEYTVESNPDLGQTFVRRRGENKLFQAATFYCLPPTVSPYDERR